MFHFRGETKLTYVISYDISKDALRRKIAKEMENYGQRVQYSVFECELSKTGFNELYEKLMKLMLGCEEGSIRFYPLCARCREKMSVMGDVEPTFSELSKEEEGLFIV